MNLNKVNKNISIYSLVFVALLTVIFAPFFVNWGILNHPFKNDINQYYSYLNALFIDHDLTFKNNVNGYWLIETPTHHFIPKVTYGMAFFYSPFYLLAKLFSGSNSTGYESIYACAVHIGCVIYILVGLWFTRKTLLFWFSEIVTSISILLLFFGTNLFYYTVSESESVHGILFFLISVFLYNVVQWHKTNSKTNFLIFAISAGFICLIRPTECLVLLFPLLMGISSMKDSKERLNKFVQLKWVFVLGVFIFLLPILPQLIYWKMQSGSYLFFSYGNSEGFFWTDPQILNVFFSFRKGFFIYTPIMLFAIFGFFVMYKSKSPLFYTTLIYFLINSYLICTWWDWSFGGSFGMRAFIHCFAILVIPFAYFTDWVISFYGKSSFKTTVVFSVAAISVFFCALNMLQSNLYKHQIIHYDGMNKEAYCYTFLKKKYSQEDLNYLMTLFKSPDYAARRKGLRDE